jgi:hypothetical protein
MPSQEEQKEKGKKWFDSPFKDDRKSAIFRLCRPSTNVRVTNQQSISAVVHSYKPFDSEDFIREFHS